MAEPEQAELELGTEAAESTASEETVEAAASEEATEVVEEEQAPDPLAEMQVQLTEEREQRIRMEERLRVRDEKPPEKVEPPKEFSRAQLRAAVSEGTIDEDQMEDIWTKQNREATKRDTLEIIEDRDRTRDVASTVETQTAKYIKNHPDVAKQGSPTWQRVKSEFDYLVSMGDDPEDKRTEVKALRAALGSADRVPERTASLRETARGTSSSQAGNSGERHSNIFSQMPEKYRSYYRKQYEEGQITMETIKKELPYMKALV